MQSLSKHLHSFGLIWLDYHRWIASLTHTNKLNVWIWQTVQYSRIKCNTIYDKRAAQYTAIKTTLFGFQTKYRPNIEYHEQWMIFMYYVWFQLKLCAKFCQRSKCYTAIFGCSIHETYGFYRLITPHIGINLKSGTPIPHSLYLTPHTWCPDGSLFWNNRIVKSESSIWRQAIRSCYIRYLFSFRI